MGTHAGQIEAPTGGAAHAPEGTGGVIEMRLRSIGQLFDPVDPSPPGEQDLSQWSADYIVESVKEMPGPVPSELHLVLVLGEPMAPLADMQVIERAVCAHFARQAVLRGRALQRLFRRGGISLAIGLVFLVICFAISRTVFWMLGDGTGSTLLREGSLIVGWVAMWRPIEIFLYEWWPILGERQLFERLSGLRVRIVGGTPMASSEPQPISEQARLAARALARWENEGGRVKQSSSADLSRGAPSTQPAPKLRPPD